jgi:hypothetical protein
LKSLEAKASVQFGFKTNVQATRQSSGEYGKSDVGFSIVAFSQITKIRLFALFFTVSMLRDMDRQTYSGLCRQKLILIKSYDLLLVIASNHQQALKSYYIQRDS